mgnify:CR=1 FL=1
MSSYLCKCDCGTERTVRKEKLLKRTTKSCGCLRREIAAKRTAQDLTGQSFSRLNVISQSHSLKGDVYWNCECICGNNITAATYHLNRGSVKSCGCLKKDVDRNRFKTHGLSKHRLYARFSILS